MEELQAAVEEAHAFGLRVEPIPAPRQVSRMRFAQESPSVEHATMIDDEGIALA